MQILSASSLASSPQNAVAELMDTLPPTQPSLAILSGNVRMFSADALAPLKERCPLLMAGSSCLGVMTDSGLAQGDDSGLGLFAIYDDDGDYGVGSAALGDDPVKAGADALTAALQSADREWETPDLIWCILPPGSEEQAIQGMVDLVGTSVPIIGGSVADNQIAGEWVQYIDGTLHHDQVVVTVFFPSGNVGFSFSSGYSPDSVTGTVTRAEGRTLLEIDGEPAADVYNRWTDGLIEDVPVNGNILMLSTRNPLGRLVNTGGDGEGFSEYLLSHPASVTPEQGIQLFTEVKEGETLHLMRGDMDSLINRAGRVVDTATKLLPPDQTAAGALIVYCAGCMLTVGESMPDVVAGIKAEFSAPFLGVFTFGEQGCFLDATNRHGNLMISAVVFGDK